MGLRLKVKRLQERGLRFPNLCVEAYLNNPTAACCNNNATVEGRKGSSSGTLGVLVGFSPIGAIWLQAWSSCLQGLSMGLHFRISSSSPVRVRASKMFMGVFG